MSLRPVFAIGMQLASLSLIASFSVIASLSPFWLRERAREN